MRRSHSATWVRELVVETLELPWRSDHDRVEVRACGQEPRLASPTSQATARGLVVALADGAGGLAHAARAAEHAVARATERWLEPAELGALDEAIAREGGETTLVALVCLASDRGLLDVRGLSVGDSRAWAVLADGCAVELTEGQSRKRLGSRRAVAHCFARTDVVRVIAASDGRLAAIA